MTFIKSELHIKHVCSCTSRYTVDAIGISIYSFSHMNFMRLTFGCMHTDLCISVIKQINFDVA